MEERYFLDQDNEGHWYVVPVSKKDDWYDWFDSNDYNDGICPKYVKEVGGSPTLVTFTNPVID